MSLREEAVNCLEGLLCAELSDGGYCVGTVGFAACSDQHTACGVVIVCRQGE